MSTTEIAVWQDAVIRSSVRVALILYVAALVTRIVDADRRRLGFARVLWTAAYAFFLVHLATSFHFVHHWSHDSAYAETARRTSEAIGWESGDGLYVNYAFALVWGLDALWWWLAPSSYRNRSAWIEAALQAFFLFIVINATVVFGVGAIRWAGGVGVAVLAFALLWRLRRSLAR